MPWLVLVKKVWYSPRFERITTPNNQIGALVNLGYSCCTTALHVYVIDIESKVMYDLVLSLSFVEIWIHSFCFQKTAKQDRFVSFEQFFVITKLCLFVITPD